MKHLVLLAIPAVVVATPALSADLYYRNSSGVVIEQPAAQVVERERIIERRYDEPALVVRERVVVEAPRYDYAPPRRAYDPQRYVAFGPYPSYSGPRWHRGYRW